MKFRRRREARESKIKVAKLETGNFGRDLRETTKKQNIQKIILIKKSKTQVSRERKKWNEGARKGRAIEYRVNV